MLSFLIPRLHHGLYKTITGNFEENINSLEENTLSIYYLSDIKSQISKELKDWEFYEKCTNIYEFLYTNIPGKLYSVCHDNPSTQTYFVIIEIFRNFFIDEYLNKPSIRTFHFEPSEDLIESLDEMRGNKNDEHFIFSNNSRVFSDKKMSNTQYENLSFVSIKNFEHISKKYISSIDFITIVNISNTDTIKSIYGNVCYALCIQKNEGSFVIKMPEIHYQFTIDIIALLSSLYQEVYITKPLSSNGNSSDKYIVCKRFIPINSNRIYPYLFSSFQKLINAPVSNFYSLFKTKNLYFTNKIEECITIITQNQIENIHSTLNLIHTERNKIVHNNTNIKSKTDHLIETNIKKCIQWCNNHHKKTNSM